MLKNTLLLKILGVILLGAGTVTAVAYYVNPSYWIFQYPKSFFNEDYYDSLKPKAPYLHYVTVVGGCGARIKWVDFETNEDGTRVYRRVAGQPNFVTIKSEGPLPNYDFGQIFHDYSPDGLPVGTYEYRVGVFNEYGETFSNISDPIEIVNANCDGPINPIITSYYVVEGCDVQINFRVYSEDEDGLRVYRGEYPAAKAIIAELGHLAGVLGGYKDQGLPTGEYYYQISAFNANGETFSGSAVSSSSSASSVMITDEMCDKAYSSQSTPFQSGNPFLVVTPTNVAQAQACIWKAAVNVFIRTGPGASVYPEITAVESGTEFLIVGQSEDGQFWAVELRPGLIGYVSMSEKFGVVTGDCKNVPTLQDPATPIPTVIPQCNDGIDNDGDSRIDGLDRECTSPNDTTE